MGNVVPFRVANWYACALRSYIIVQRHVPLQTD